MISVVSHDAGGAEILASYIFQKKISCQFVLKGPAIDVFANRFGEIENIPLEEAIKSSDWCLFGSSGQSNLEWEGIKIAKTEGKRCIVYLDHWVHYRERFIRNNIEHLPDEIWVGDEYAFSMAKEIFPSIEIKLIPNPHFKDIEKEIKKVSDNKIYESFNNKNILYVCEKIEYENFHQNDSIRFLFENMSYISSNISQVTIRNHPSESIKKYYWIKEEFDLPIKYSKGVPLLNEILDNDIVVGCSTMAMVVGLLAKRRVISCIPDNKIPLSLPFQGIENLSDLIKRAD